MINRHGRTLLVCSICLSGLFLFSNAVFGAQQGPSLELKTTVEKEVKVQKNGKEVLERIPAEKTGPGEILVYTIAYQNGGKVAAVDAAIVDPIPRGVVYLLGTAEGADAEIACSIDNSRTWHRPPIMVAVKKPDGSLESKPAPTEKYTHIRWIIKKPVQPGQTGRVSFKATVR